MYVSLNKQLISFQIVLAVYLGRARGSVKRRFLISNVSAGNMLPASCGLGGPILEAVSIVVGYVLHTLPVSYSVGTRAEAAGA